MRKRWQMTVLGTLAFLAACDNGSSLPGSPPTGGFTDPTRPRHVYVRMPADATGIEHLYEGAGLVRRVDPVDMNGETNWWTAFLDQMQIDEFERGGAVIRERSKGSGLEPKDQTGESCSATALSNTFCGYDNVIMRCSRTIAAEIDAVSTDYPASAAGGTTYASSWSLGTTAGGRPIKAVRIGRHYVSGSPAVPQMIVYAAQHAREWIGSEMTMRLIRHFAGSFRDNTNGVRGLLANMAIVFVPVANPDGFVRTHTVARNWRPNYATCDNGQIGTDPNRNFATGWGQVGASDACATAENSTYRGDSAGSEAETSALDLLGIWGGPPGSYLNQLGVNTHAYGNFLIFSEGLGTGCGTDSNCTAADLGGFYKLVTDGVHARMRDEESNTPYQLGSIMRKLYPASGDSGTRHLYAGSRFLTVSAEITHTECNFRAENLPDSELTTIETNWRTFIRHLVTQVPAIHAGTFFDNYSLPHIHRRQLTGTTGELPTLRIAIKKGLTSPSFIGATGTGEPDSMTSSAEYNMYRWRPSTPYVFPKSLSVCAVGASCRYVKLAMPSGDTTANLCSSSRFGGTGFTWQADVAGSPNEECFWRFTRAKVGPNQLTSGSWVFPPASRLVFSYRWTEGQVTSARVLVSDNGFTGCSTTGTGCRIVQQFPYGVSNYEFRDNRMRTEIVNVGDFDNRTAQVRFEVLSSTSGGAAAWDIIDPVVVGNADD